MKKYWWKIACIILMFYTVLAGLMIPLGAGITSVSTSQAKILSEFNTTIKTYNTHFTKDHELPWAWFKNDSLRLGLRAGQIDVIDDTTLKLTFTIPSIKIGKGNCIFADLVINSEGEGNYMENDAIQIFNDSVINAVDCLKSPFIIDYITCFGHHTKSADHIHFPYRAILYESIRNLFFHVPMWFTMMLIISISLIYSIKYLRTFNLDDDIIAVEASKVGIFFGVLGLITGSIWARFTWLAWWPSDVKVNGAAVTLLIYFAYLILRNSVEDAQKRARIAAVYSIIAFTMLVLFLIIFPRMNDSLHPGNGGNPGFSKYDLDSTMRTVFYPAVIGWCLLGMWILNLRIRIAKLLNIEYK